MEVFAVSAIDIPTGNRSARRWSLKNKMTIRFSNHYIVISFLLVFCLRFGVYGARCRVVERGCRVRDSGADPPALPTDRTIETERERESQRENVRKGGVEGTLACRRLKVRVALVLWRVPTILSSTRAAPPRNTCGWVKVTRVLGWRGSGLAGCRVVQG